MYPKYEQLKKMAVEKKYHRIPVAIEMYADVTTPVEALKKLRNVSQRCYLFESASQDERWGRYSFIGCNPEMEIVCNNGKIKQLFYKNEEKTGQAKPDEDNPRIFLRKLIEANKSPVLSEMPPFTGGLVGYFAYDYLKYGEPKLKLTNKGDFNDLDLMLFNETVVFDHYRQKIVLIANVNPAELDESLEVAKKKLKNLRNVLAGKERFEFEKLELKSSLETEFSLQINDEITLGEIEKLNPQAIILSQGPGRPDDAGICLDLIRRFAGNVPILGVCLGHQAICQAFGGKIVHAKHLMHGKTSQVKIVSKSNLFKGIKSGFTAARYHSLTADPDSLPSELKVTAQDVDDQEIMAVENSDKSIYGVQFHPESIMTEDGKKIIENFLEA